MIRGDPERIYQAQRAGFHGPLSGYSEYRRRRVKAVLDALEAECASLGLRRGSPAFWQEAEGRVKGTA